MALRHGDGNLSTASGSRTITYCCVAPVLSVSLWDDATGLKNCAEGLKKILPHAEKRGVIICMELLNSR